MRIFAISLIISLCLTNTSFSLTYYESGKEAFKKGDYAIANKMFKHELRKHPENIKCRYFYAQSFVGTNELKKALTEYEKVMEQSPNSELARLSAIAISRIHGYYLKKPK